MNNWSPRVLRAVENELHGVPPGSTLLEITGAFSDLSALAVRRILDALIEQERATVATHGSTRRYWRIDPAQRDSQRVAA